MIGRLREVLAPGRDEAVETLSEAASRPIDTAERRVAGWFFTRIGRLPN
jgi:hypothetical protein